MGEARVRQNFDVPAVTFERLEDHWFDLLYAMGMAAGPCTYFATTEEDSLEKALSLKLCQCYVDQRCSPTAQVPSFLHKTGTGPDGAIETEPIGALYPP